MELKNVIYDADLKNYSTVRIGGKAKYLFLPKSVKEIRDIIYYLNENKIKYDIIGNGSNVLFCTDYYDGAIICLKNINGMYFDGEYLTVMAGENINNVIAYCIKKRLTGLEFLYGIPATVGGLIKMNGGAFGCTVADFLVKVSMLVDGKLVIKDSTNFAFKYRKSNLGKGIILDATFKLKYDKSEYILARAKNYLKLRHSKFPKGPSLGSIFKNPAQKKSGELIEKLGLKGYNIGDAEISQKHANFFLNKGNATFCDYLSLIDFVKKLVLENYNILLEEEIKYIGGKNDS